MGSTIKEQFTDSLFFDVFGIVTGSVTSTQFADNPCGMVRFKADSANVNAFKLGKVGAGFTAFPLYAGDDTGWVSTSNLDRYIHSDASGTMDYLYWWLQK